MFVFLLQKTDQLFGRWHCIATALFKTPLHGKGKKSAESSDIQYDFSMLENIISALQPNETALQSLQYQK